GPVQFAAGFGVRLPTGSFEDVPAAQRPTGAGYTAVAIKTYLDIPLARGMILAHEHQIEKTISKAKRKKSSLVDPTKLNTGDPTTAEAIAAGSDGKAENEYERDGFRNVGFLRYKVGLGLIDPALHQLGVGVGMDYDYRA